MTDGNRNSGWGGDGGYGTGDGTFNGGIPNGFALATDFASLERETDGADNGLCDGFHVTANGMDTGPAAVRNALCRGFSGVTQAVTSQGYGSRLGTRAAIQANATRGAVNANAIRQQAASRRCENEKQAMRTRFENRRNRCATVQPVAGIYHVRPGAAATSDAVKPRTGCGEFHRAGSGSVRLRAGPYAFDFTGNVGGAAGTQPNLTIAVDGDVSPETTTTETVTLATDVRNAHVSTKFRDRLGGSTVTVVDTGPTPVELAANPALVAEREAWGG